MKRLFGVKIMFNILLSSLEIDKLQASFIETIYLLLSSSLISIPVGTLLGFILALYGKNRIFENKLVSYVLSVIISVIRSIPFILLMVLVVPVSYDIFNKSYGFIPSLLSLSIIGIATVSRLVEQAIIDLNPNIYDVAHAMGATKFQLFTKFILVEAKSAIILGYTSSLISLLAYSSVVYVIGGGGLGQSAIVDGYQNPYGNKMMWAATILMILLVQLIQILGSFLANYLDKKKRGIS